MVAEAIMLRFLIKAKLPKLPLTQIGHLKNLALKMLDPTPRIMDLCISEIRRSCQVCICLSLCMGYTKISIAIECEGCCACQ